MSLFKVINNGDLNLAIWQINEPLDELKRTFNGLGLEQSLNMDIRHKGTLKNKIAARLALVQLFHRLGLDSESLDIERDEHGKLHLPGQPYEISISHCNGWAAAMLSDKKLVGVDIEVVGDRARRIRRKFCSESELKEFQNDQEIHLVWGAKEAMYKAYGRKKLIFKSDMSLSRNVHGEFIGRLMKNGVTQSYSVYHEKIFENVLLVYTIQV